MARRTRERGSVGAAKLAMVPAGPSELDELEGDPLDGLLVDHLPYLGRQVCRRGLTPGRCIASEDLMAEGFDDVRIAVHSHVALEHHPAQLLVLLSRLHLQGGAGVTLDVAHLLGDPVGPGPKPWPRLTRGGLPQYVPE